ncbi:Inositol transporter 1 isoform 1 [Hibiscus syriacus]|uniref:Inositol transporter 1 isoform 1 n=1 Tax=Hibiscus syriacus TaxID=106335 RepID=A0A6A2ZFX2_HIBSY|nr:uncharacterized protein LOC120145983 [Hibiscus syriacus]KAE8690466.1 Inositol transporter 1 isoform 1 [Hibiscus syriacus]
MVGSSSQTQSLVSTMNSDNLDKERLDLMKIDQEDDDNNKSNQDMISAKKNKKNRVLLEAVDELKRTKSLTGDDLDELKGCLDLGFGFSYDEIPELCNTLPALELCYSMSPTNTSPDTTVPNWKISTPGDHPEDVKARLKFWAQAVACTVKLCN